MSDDFQPEIWPVRKDAILAAIPALGSGVEYARECLATHDATLGRTTRKNKTWAELIENDLRQMDVALTLLHACGPGAKP